MGRRHGSREPLVRRGKAIRLNRETHEQYCSIRLALGNHAGYNRIKQSKTEDAKWQGRKESQY